MTRIQVELPDGDAQSIVGATDEEFDASLSRAEQLRQFGQRHDEAKLRKVVVWYLLIAGTLILLVSLLLIIDSAFGRSHLGQGAVSALIGSVAAEFVGMLYFVVRYLFREER